METSTQSGTATWGREQDSYAAFEGLVANRIALLAGPVFTTNITPESLWDTYLLNIPSDRRQVYNCHCCRNFVKRYGGLVVIDDKGNTAPVAWDVEAPGFFASIVAAFRDRLALHHAKVDGVFLSDGKWGTAQTGEWGHLHGTSPCVYAERAKTAAQAMAEKSEDYGILCRGLADYGKPVVEQALRVLKADALDRSEKTLGVAQWLYDLHTRIEGTRGNQRSNLIWKAVATAPPGFCHVRSTMISTLLDDILSGMAFDAISSRWAEKMHPLRYQRPQAAPNEGTIRQAEALVEKLGATSALKRRFALLSDVQVKLWEPRSIPPAEKTGGVFDHLRGRPNRVSPIELPSANITWEKFSRTVLPNVLSMDVHTPSHGAYYGLVTAADPDALAIIQWDGLAGHPRNPVSWYFYHGGSSAGNWALSAGWNKVTAVFMGPHLWHEPAKFKHHNQNVHFSIAGAKDQLAASLCLFPEILKTEFHGIRAVIEAHSLRDTIQQIDGEQANGLAFQGRDSSVAVRVVAADGTASYRIDRFD